MDPIFSSPVLGTLVTAGNLAIWLGLASAITCVVLYWTAMIRTMRLHPTPTSGTREGSAAAEAAHRAGAGGAIGNGTNGNGKSGNGKNGARRSGKPELPPAAGEARAALATERIGGWARRMFFVTCGMGVMGALCLWALIFQQQYVVEYVHKVSNSTLPSGYRFASFWSDQEGTFFLWILYNTVLGSLLIFKARQDERWVLPFFALINVSLFTLLTFMNPFWLPSAHGVRETIVQMFASMPGSLDMSKLSFLPADHDFWGNFVYYFGWGKYVRITDGRGLNESLQNFWMVIHPPTLFVGYSSMIVPGCFALAALMKRDYDHWVNRAAPWLLWAWSILGTGIFLGAYWAYETLGWGGYWGWDPVENSSLIPWMVGSALIHGLLSQRARGNFKQANLFIGVLVSNAVLLGSFLVRSGVLSEASKHSFASPQQAVFNTLLGIMVIWFVMSMGIWIWRFKDIQSEIAYDQVWERHFGFFLGLIVLSASAIIITFGVTMPIWKAWMPGLGQKANVDFTFYNKALLPVMYVTVLLMAITPLMPWRQAREGKPLPPFTKAVLGLSAAITAFFLFAAVWAWAGGFRGTRNDLAYLAFGMIMALSLTTTGVVLVRSLRGGILNAGAWVAHAGFLIMLLSVVITSRFNKTFPVRLAQGETAHVLGMDWSWVGQRSAANAADRDRMLIDATTKDGRTMHFSPKLFVSKQGDGKQAMAWPEIHHEWWSSLWGDLYVEPTAVDLYNTVQIPDLKLNGPPSEPVTIQRLKDAPQDFVSAQLLNLDMTDVQKAMRNNTGRTPIAHMDLLLNVNGTEKKIREDIRLIQDPTQGMQFDPIPVPLEGLHQGVPYVLFLDASLQPGNVTATAILKPEEARAQGYFQVLHVPGIQVLWLGCIVLFIGGFMTWRRRSQLAARGVPPVTGVRSREPEAVPAPTHAPEPELV